MDGNRGLAVVAALAVACAALAPDVAGADSVPPAVREAIKAELPGGIPDVAREAPLYSGPGGEYRVYPLELDGAEPAECVLTFQEPGKPARAVFLGVAGGKVTRFAVDLPGGDAERSPVVTQVAFSDTQALVVVKDSKSGSVLVGWDGKSASTVWDSGKPRKGETRWYELDDLDEDGVREIVTYQKSVLDVALDDDFGETAGGGSTEIVEPVAVLRLDGGKWKKEPKLLEGLR